MKLVSLIVVTSVVAELLAVVIVGPIFWKTGLETLELFTTNGADDWPIEVLPLDVLTIGSDDDGDCGLNKVDFTNRLLLSLAVEDTLKACLWNFENKQIANVLFTLSIT